MAGLKSACRVCHQSGVHTWLAQLLSIERTWQDSSLQSSLQEIRWKEAPESRLMTYTLGQGVSAAGAAQECIQSKAEWHSG